MKVFALGGYGKVGFPAIKLLAQCDLVTEIAIAGRNPERAEKAAAEAGEKATAVRADGTNEQELTSLLAGYDIIMNAAYDGTVLPAIRAAIHTGAHYCDANGVNEQALQMTSEARGAGITAIICNGIHPSISNLMGVHAARQLDEVEQLQLWDASVYNFQKGVELTPGQWLEDSRQSLIVVHGYRSYIAWMLQMLQRDGIRTVLDFQDGQWVEVNAVKSGLEVPQSQGGTITLYPYFSANPLFGSLPRGLSNISPVEMFFSPFPPQLHDVLRKQALRVLEENIDADAATNAFYDTVESDPQRWLSLPDNYVPIPKLWARAVGRKDGHPARHSCWFTTPIWNAGGWFLTSVALTVAVRKILRGEILKRGVMHAETAFDPQSFFDETASLIPDLLPDGKLIEEAFEQLA